jgi:hypothetical protein
MQREKRPLFATTPHFFPPKEKRVNVKKIKRVKMEAFPLRF